MHAADLGRAAQIVAHIARDLQDFIVDKGLRDGKRMSEVVVQPPAAVFRTVRTAKGDAAFEIEVRDAFDFGGFANGAFGDEPFGVLDAGHVLETCRKGGFDAFGLRQLVEFSCGVSCCGHWLGAENMAACRDGLFDLVVVRAAWGGDGYDVGAEVSQGCCPIRTGKGDAQASGDVSHDMLCAPDNAHDLTARRAKRGGVALAGEARACDQNLHRPSQPPSTGKVIPVT